MTSIELMKSVARMCLGYATLGVRVTRDDIISSLTQAQTYVAEDMLGYQSRQEIADENEEESYEKAISNSKLNPDTDTQQSVFTRATQPEAAFRLQEDGSIEPSDPTLPSYCHPAIAIRAVIILTPTDAEVTSLYERYNYEIRRAKRCYSMMKSDRKQRVVDNYNPNRHNEAE